MINIGSRQIIQKNRITSQSKLPDIVPLGTLPPKWKMVDRGRWLAALYIANRLNGPEIIS